MMASPLASLDDGDDVPVHPARVAIASPAAASPADSRLMLCLFIIEPLSSLSFESFGWCTESDRNIARIGGIQFVVKPNK